MILVILSIDGAAADAVVDQFDYDLAGARHQLTVDTNPTEFIDDTTVWIWFSRVVFPFFLPEKGERQPLRIAKRHRCSFQNCDKFDFLRAVHCTAAVPHLLYRWPS